MTTTKGRTSHRSAETAPGEEATHGTLPEGGALSAQEEKEAKKAAQMEEAKKAFRAMKPWKGKATRQDKVLLGVVLGIPLFFMALTPLKPFLIADHPVLLGFVTGSNAAIGAAAAFARIGEIPLWLVVVAGVVGKVKVDWLFWWLGRRWGRGFVNMLAQGETAQRFADRAQGMNPWVVRAALLLGYLPGIPLLFVHVIAGWTGMRLAIFLVLDTLGALLLTGTVAAVGFASGQAGVDVVLLVDKYALWVTLGIICAMAFVPAIKAQRAAKAAEAAKAEETAKETAKAEEAAETAETKA